MEPRRSSSDFARCTRSCERETHCAVFVGSVALSCVATEKTLLKPESVEGSCTTDASENGRSCAEDTIAGFRVSMTSKLSTTVEATVVASQRFFGSSFANPSSFLGKANAYVCSVLTSHASEECVCRFGRTFASKMAHVYVTPPRWKCWYLGQTAYPTGVSSIVLTCAAFAKMTDWLPWRPKPPMSGSTVGQTARAGKDIALRSDELVST
mmetsp:Transcript_29303/g.95502  ORF Transcript_29303/g.95502 Transcript_29303/m.95502 type:complete len:210 (-) Transcript_29303:222-851(-)